MSVLDELREHFDAGVNEWDPGAEEANRVNVMYTGDEVLAVIDAFEAAHPGLEDHTLHCVVCGKPMRATGNTLVFTTDNGRTIGWQHSECVGRPACAEEEPSP